VELVLENCKSKSGKHVVRSLMLEVKDGEFKEVLTQGKKVKPTYTVGEATVPDLGKIKGTVIYLRFVRNLKRKVRGEVIIINNGKTVLRANYRKLKLKRVEGEESQMELARKAMEQLKLPVKKVNPR